MPAAGFSFAGGKGCGNIADASSALAIPAPS
jgi:hypothetical protein